MEYKEEIIKMMRAWKIKTCYCTCTYLLKEK